MQDQRILIDKFLRFRRIAVVGVSSNADDFSRKLWVDFRTRGVEAIPVHPQQQEIFGVKCYRRLEEIKPVVEGALLLLAKHRLAGAVKSCQAAGVGVIWIYGTKGKKGVDREIIKFCDNHNIALIAGYCPYMFLKNTSLYHRLHALIYKMMGQYPK